MLKGTKARRNDNIFHLERRDGLVLCLLKPKPHICIKKSPTPPTTVKLCATQPLSLQEEISGNVRQGTRFARQQLPLRRAVQRLNQHHPVVRTGAHSITPLQYQS